MYTVIIGFTLFAAVLLVLVVLAQNSKGGGLSNQFGGSGASNLIGVKKTGDILEKLTWGLAVAIMVLTLSTNFVNQNNSSSSDELIDRAKEQQAAPANLDLKKPDAAASKPDSSKKKLFFLLLL
jgi:preprotein translocase subunit SecG